MVIESSVGEANTSVSNIPYGIIYCAFNKTNGKRYIGQTIQSLRQRSQGHGYDAFKKRIETYFARALRKYGKDGFDFYEIDKAYSREELNYLEKYWIKFFRATNSEYGYNATEGGYDGSPNLEVRARQSAMRKGKENPAHSIRLKRYYEIHPEARKN